MTALEVLDMVVGVIDQVPGQPHAAGRAVPGARRLPAHRTPHRLADRALAEPRRRAVQRGRRPPKRRTGEPRPRSCSPGPACRRRSGTSRTFGLSSRPHGSAHQAPRALVARVAHRDPARRGGPHGGAHGRSGPVARSRAPARRRRRRSARESPRRCRGGGVGVRPRLRRAGREDGRARRCRGVPKPTTSRASPRRSRSTPTPCASRAGSPRHSSSCSDQLPAMRESEVPTFYVRLLLANAWCEVDLGRLGRAQECFDELAATVRMGEHLDLQPRGRPRVGADHAGERPARRGGRQADRGGRAGRAGGAHGDRRGRPGPRGRGLVGARRPDGRGAHVPECDPGAQELGQRARAGRSPAWRRPEP